MRQYIGARYVPKFEGTWANNRTYEALCVVDYNGDSYTSKKPVPVGVAPTNTSYWALTGAYNSQVNDIKNELDLIKAGKDKKFIFIGDSYGEQGSFLYDVWTTTLPNLMGLTLGSDYWKNSLSGAGFCNSPTFLSELQTVEGNVTDPDDITDIYVLGGINDNSYSKSQILTAIQNFITYTKTAFKNATIHIGHISMSTDNVGVYNMSSRTLPAYSSCGEYGAVYAPLQDTLADYSLLNNDGVHPNATGQDVLSGAIYEYIKGKSIFTRHRTNRTFSGTGSNTIYPAANKNVVEYEENGRYGMRFVEPYVTISFPSSITLSSSYVDLVTFDDSSIGTFPRASIEIGVCFRCRVSGSWESTVRTGTLKYDGANDKLQIASDFTSISNVEGIALIPFEFSATSFGV